MNSIEIFQLALQLTKPWSVTDVRFQEASNGKQELHITISFERGFVFEPESKVHDTQYRTWRHLNFFEHECYLHCKVPRIKTTDGKVKTVEVPWARKGSGFTLLFEAFSMALIEREMPVNKAADLVNEYPQRIWNIFNYWIQIAYRADDQSSVTQLGIDETSVRKGHDYVTVAADLATRRVIHVTPGKDRHTIGRIKDHLKAKGVEHLSITDACIDMSTGFIAGMLEHFPNTSVTFDKFHVVKLLNEAMDDVRKREVREHSILKGHKYTLLKSTHKLSAKQKQDRQVLIELLPTIGKAYRLKTLFQSFWEFKTKEEGSAFLAYWCDLVEEEGLYAFKKFVNTIKSHWQGITNYVESQIANGVMEGINSKIQLAKRRARGYRNITNFINMIYFISSKLKFNYPQYST
ncbi:ISL3 family transposase [Cytophagaceae bacterium ABcell3]|nr:ISL3 family transposase [Cytophagaceae bacterium ABcell3]WMJ72550.1 ISL3 family transposase [Cytophagaceae bacterium ABcell3]WMJ73352.1 ISL3 family transposase [Cytophagaceae bacterium ABcell3]WMJ73938.1 ISL3 family transposase [Cytophagaceae bacterium ABcell3]WMJ74007.1 ISL3 family transposase [Cytophagaceae bacterium ABcell3]